jgi:PAS domain S-box-containing protein
LEASQARYFVLYNLAPVGYITFGALGLIREANLTAADLLGAARGALIDQALTHFIVPEDQDILYHCRQQLLGTSAPQACELRMRRAGATDPFWARLEMTVGQDADQALVIRVAISDITERVGSAQKRQQAETALRASEARDHALAEENAHLLAQSRQDGETQAILLQEVNHRVKNNLAAIIGLLQLEMRYLGAGQQLPYRALMEDLTSRIQSLAVVHNLLSANRWAPIPLEKLAENVMRMAPVMMSHRPPVQMKISPTAVHLSPKQASAVGLILNELAINSLKHALSQDAPICLYLQTYPTSAGVELEYRDNGRGYPEEILQGKRVSVGLYLIEALAEHDLSGQITFSNDQGAVARLCFALAPARLPEILS